MFKKMVQEMANSAGISLPASHTSSDSDYAEFQIKLSNEAVGQLTGLDCDRCKNKGVIYFLRDLETVARECQCMEARRSIGRMRRSGLTNLADTCTFDNFQTPEKWQQAVKEDAMRFADNPSGWFAAVGAVGSGKTHLCTAICIHLLRKGYSARWMPWRDDSVRLKGCVNDTQEYDRYIMPLKTADVLYIDDLFKTEKHKGVTTADINLAFELLNYRYNNPELITIISSERTVMDMVDIDEAVGSRIYQRTKGNCVVIGGRDKNWRMRQ